MTPLICVPSASHVLPALDAQAAEVFAAAVEAEQWREEPVKR